MKKRKAGEIALVPHWAEYERPEAALRDHFAEMVLVHVLNQRYSLSAMMNGPSSPTHEEIADNAYGIADAMIAARKGKLKEA